MSIPVEIPSTHTTGKELTFQLKGCFNRLFALLEIDYQIKQAQGISEEDNCQHINAANMMALTQLMIEPLAPLLDQLRGVFPPTKDGEKENENPNSRIDLISRLTALRLWIGMLHQLVTMEAYAFDDVNKEQLLPQRVTVFDMSTKATHSLIVQTLFAAYPGMEKRIEDKVKNAHREVVQLTKPESTT